MIRRLVALLPIPGCAAAVYGAWEIYQPAGLLTLAAACFVLEWRYDRDDQEENRP
jgi:hypothetical protein